MRATDLVGALVPRALWGVLGVLVALGLRSAALAHESALAALLPALLGVD